MQVTACSLTHTTFENMEKEGTGEWLFLFYYVPSLCFPQMGMWQTARTQWRTPGWVSHPQHERFCTIFDKSRKNGNNHSYHFEMLVLCKCYMLRLSLMLPEKKPNNRAEGGKTWGYFTAVTQRGGSLPGQKLGMCRDQRKTALPEIGGWAQGKGLGRWTRPRSVFEFHAHTLVLLPCFTF